jgi:hypothetical protein
MLLVFSGLSSRPVPEAGFSRVVDSACCLLGLYFGLEDGGSISLRKDGEHGFTFSNSP